MTQLAGVVTEGEHLDLALLPTCPPGARARAAASFPWEPAPLPAPQD